MVYGDTNSTLAGACCKQTACSRSTMEAGLRSFMMAMPETKPLFNRPYFNLAIFALQKPLSKSSKEGIVHTARWNADNKCVALTGDIMYDASLYYRSINKVQNDEKDFILLTIHRQENTDTIERLSSIVKAINSLDTFTFIFPAHPRTRKILAQAGLAFKNHVKLIEPVGYFEMLKLEENCSLVLTDSGAYKKKPSFSKTLYNPTRFNRMGRTC